MLERCETLVTFKKATFFLIKWNYGDTQKTVTDKWCVRKAVFFKLSGTATMMY